MNTHAYVIATYNARYARVATNGQEKCRGFQRFRSDLEDDARFGGGGGSGGHALSRAAGRASVGANSIMAASDCRNLLRCIIVPSRD